MFNFLHTNIPDPILIAIGPINIYWYGIFIVLSILTGSLVTIKLAEKYNINKNFIIDSVFWLIVGGIIGARIYHILLELPFYLKQPLTILKLWQGGLAIHGAILFGFLTLWYIAKKSDYNFWHLLSLYAPGLIIAQAIGRWGNYFNQELFGQPTSLPWGIPIDTIHRIPEYYNAQYFHPTFLYESVGNLLIFIVLVFLHSLILKKQKSKELRIIAFKFIVGTYLTLYSILRFLLEFMRIDLTPEFLGLRFPQIISLLLILSIGVYFYKILSNLTPRKKS